MSDQNSETPKGDRATVALVSEKVDGLKALVNQGFEGVQRQLDPLAEMPARMSVLEERQRGIGARQDAQEKRMDTLDKRENEDQAADRTFRRVNLPSLVISGLAILASLALYLIQNL